MGEAHRTHTADDGHLRLLCEGGLKPESRWYCPSRPELHVACQTEWPGTRLRFERRCRPLVKSGLDHCHHRRGVAHSFRGHAQQLVGWYESALHRASCVVCELSEPLLPRAHWSL